MLRSYRRLRDGNVLNTYGDQASAAIRRTQDEVWQFVLRSASDDQFEHAVNTMETMTVDLDATSHKGDPS